MPSKISFASAFLPYAPKYLVNVILQSKLKSLFVQGGADRFLLDFEGLPDGFGFHAKVANSSINFSFVPDTLPQRRITEVSKVKKNTRMKHGVWGFWETSGMADDTGTRRASQLRRLAVLTSRSTSLQSSFSSFSTFFDRKSFRFDTKSSEPSVLGPRIQ